LRQLVVMTRGRQRSEWMQTASILTILANVHRDRKKRNKPFKPEDFMPNFGRRGRGREPKPIVQMKDLKHLYTRKGLK
jgi:hypothetical protein